MRPGTTCGSGAAGGDPGDPPEVGVKEAWQEAFGDRARRYWTEERTRQLNGDKNLPLLPGEAPVLLRAMGLLKQDGSLPPSRVRKYRQINHMILVLQPALTRLCAEFDTVRVLDAGCGRSYLTMLLAWWFAEHQHHRAEILGVDRSAELVETCRRRADLAELKGLSFRASPLADLALAEPPPPNFRNSIPEPYLKAFVHTYGDSVQIRGRVLVRAFFE